MPTDDALSGTIGPGQRARRRKAGTRGDIGRARLARQRHRHSAVLEQARQLALGKVRELARASAGEIDAIGRTQPARLAFEIGTGIEERPTLVDEAVPDVDIGDAGLAPLPRGTAS